MWMGGEFTSPSPQGLVLGGVVCLPEEHREYLVQQVRNLLQCTTTVEQAGK
jgi:hypothetical protein